MINTKDLTPLQQAEKESLLKKVKKPEQIADSAGAGALSMVMEIQEPAISPISSQDQLSQTNVFDDSRPLESTRLMASHLFERSTIAEDKTIIGGLSQDTTLQSSPSLLCRYDDCFTIVNKATANNEIGVLDREGFNENSKINHLTKI